MTSVYSIGQSSRPIADLLGRLTEDEICDVVEVRSVPYSRRFPDLDVPGLRRCPPCGIGLGGGGRA